MKRVFLKLVFFGLIAFLGFNPLIETALAENLNKIVVGKWNQIETTSTLEFFEDGTIIFLDSNEELVGDYRFIDQNRVRIDFGGMGGWAGPQVTRISVDGDKLILEKIFDKKLILKRMNEAREIFLEGLKSYRKKEYKKAAELYEKAAELGDVEAQAKIGAMYADGKGVEQDYKQAFKWALKGAKQDSAHSQIMLGYLYVTGNGTEKDIEKAIFWLQKVVDNVESPYQIMAQSGLAIIYATSENPDYWDGEKAQKYAEMAYSQQPEDWGINRTLAAAYARQNQFDKAVATQKRAMDLLKRDRDLSQEKRQKEFEEAKIILGLYQSGQAYDESYDIDGLVVKNKEEQKKAEEAKNLAEEEARKKQQAEYEKQQAEQKRRMEDEAEKRRNEELRLAALKNEYMNPSKVLYSFKFSFPVRLSKRLDEFKEIAGEIKNTEIFWRSRRIVQKGEIGQINKNPPQANNWVETSIWFGNIKTAEMLNNSGSYSSSSTGNVWYLRINGGSPIESMDKTEIEGLYNELIAALSSWYDEFSDVAPQKPRPAFLSKTGKVKATEEIKPEVDKTLVFNIQKKLGALGYYNGKFDGVSGQGTASAIKAYQNDNGLIPDGMPTEKLLTHLSTKKTTYDEPQQIAETKSPAKPQNLEDAVNKAVDGIFKSIFKTK